MALKLLPPELAGDVDFRQRFRREARIAAQLTEPHIIPIHDFGEIGGRLFIDMRLVEGSDLTAVLAGVGPLEPARAVDIIDQVAMALGAAHRAGLVHRDVKPANILATQKPHDSGGGEFVYLADFGIARSSTATTRMTATGVTVGTLDYMAPERFQDSTSADHRVDIYALGCVLYELVTGHRPFVGADQIAMMYAHLNTPPPQASKTRPGLPVELDAVITKAMAKDPDNRYPTPEALASAAHYALTTATKTTSSAARTPPQNTQTREEDIKTQLQPSPEKPSKQTRKTPVPAEGRVTTEGLEGTPSPAFFLRWSFALRVVALVIVIVAIPTVVYMSLPQEPTRPDTAAPAAPPPTAPTPATSAQPLTNRVATISVWEGPAGIVITPDGAHAYVADEGSDANPSSTVSVIDTATNTVTGSIPVGLDPGGIAITPDGSHVYVSNAGSKSAPGNTVSVIDTATNTVTATIPVGQGPDGIVIASDGAHAYVAQTGTDAAPGNTVSVIDTATNTVTATIPVGQGPTAIALAPNGAHLYVSQAGTTAAPGNTVSVIDTATNTVTATIPVGQGPAGIAITPDGAYAYVANNHDGTVSVIDIARASLTATITVGSNPFDVERTPDGRFVYVTLLGSIAQPSKLVSVIDTSSNTVATLITSDTGPANLAFTPNGQRVYIANYSSNTLSVFGAG